MPVAREVQTIIIQAMEQLITHACGHEQVHYLTGFAGQQDRKARWLRTTLCRICFIAGRREEQATLAAQAEAAVAHLDLPKLSGSDRQIAWATTIRASGLAALVADIAGMDDEALTPCLEITDAKWWIDHRDLPAFDLIAAARMHSPATDRLGSGLLQAAV